jgi:agmatine/peptidylarginine deiminase
MLKFSVCLFAIFAILASIPGDVTAQYWRYNGNVNRYNTNSGVYGNNQPYSGRYYRNGFANGQTFVANPTVSFKPNADDRDNHAAVTPEEAMKLYNRPKTNPPPKFKPGSLYPRIGGEFEPQNAIVLSLSEMLPQHGSVLKRIAELTGGHVRLVVLFNDTEQVKAAMKVFSKSKSDLSHVYFMNLKMDTVWLRDFGPILAEDEDGSMTIDFFYSGQRPTDDTFPKRWADLITTTHNSIPWTIQGGNLLCNGKGLALTTTRIFEDNEIRFPDAKSNVPAEKQKFIINEFKNYTNLKHIEVLEPLRNEATKHVDMFASFVSPEKVLVAKLADPRRDPMNARVLDYNANRLSKIKIDGKALEVVRVPIPPRVGTSWSPYTNVIIANKLVMLPVMKTDDRKVLRQAVEVYRQALPDHRVATVDLTSMAKLQGALHCLSVNIPKYAPLPKKLVPYEKVRVWAERKKSQ